MQDRRPAAAGKTGQEDPTTDTGGDTERRIAIVVRGTARDPAASALPAAEHSGEFGRMAFSPSDLRRAHADYLSAMDTDLQIYPYLIRTFVEE